MDKFCVNLKQNELLQEMLFECQVQTLGTCHVLTQVPSILHSLTFCLAHLLISVLGQQRALNAVHEAVEAARQVAAFVRRLRTNDALA